MSDNLKIKKYANGTTSTIELGGPPAYAAISARSLGFNVDILSKVGTDFPEHFLQQLSANSKYIKRFRGNSTKFELSYSNQELAARLASIISIARSNLLIVRSCPTSHTVTSIGGDTGPPVTATRIGWPILPMFRS